MQPEHKRLLSKIPKEEPVCPLHTDIIRVAGLPVWAGRQTWQQTASLSPPEQSRGWQRVRGSHWAARGCAGVVYKRGWKLWPSSSEPQHTTPLMSYRLLHCGIHVSGQCHAWVSTKKIAVKKIEEKKLQRRKRVLVKESQGLTSALCHAALYEDEELQSVCVWRERRGCRPFIVC